jgi:D-alanyl-D-alanine carboxypeptidase/D-alanyl-D-alanine-endopeptidase (penicillin-binding protein 4)
MLMLPALGLALTLCPAPAAPRPTARDARILQAIVERVAQSRAAHGARLGVVVEDAATGRILVQRNADGEFAPASNFKLLDAAAALAYLGSEFRFRTTLVARGSVNGGVLQGDLILVGGGDPVLTRADLAQAVAAVRSAGITKVSGTVLADTSIWDDQRYGGGWAWDDMPYYYQPPIEALAIDEGTVAVTVSPGLRSGDPLRATLERDPGEMTVTALGVTSPPKGAVDADCFRSPGSRSIEVVGHLPVGAQPATLHCAVDSTTDQTVAVFSQMLADAGVTVGDAAVGPVPDNGVRDVEDQGPLPAPLAVRYPGAAVVWTHDSAPLIDLVRRMMPPSDNFIAEHLFKMLPVAAFGRRGSFDGGAAAERRFIGWLGLDPASIDNGDGSGLSQGDRITPRDLVTILRWEARRAGGCAYVTSLARAGIEGTVRRHLRGTDAVGRVRAKDGYIWHVSTISGYALSRRHGLMIFSIMVNDVLGPLRPVYRAQDAIIKAIVDLP